ncbi:MAG: N-acetylneuraminate synthase [Planctomycetota bacterium]|jgi:N-acetylneuraminate synthase
MTVAVGKCTIGPSYPCFIIAEAGVNHGGNLGVARQLVDIAVTAGADAVKFQTFQAAKLASPQAPKAEYQRETTNATESQYDMLRRLELSRAAHRELKSYCDERGVLFLSTPFGESSADFLHDLGVSAFKIPSGELTNLPFLAHVASKGKPMIVSTGMATLGEVETAVNTIEMAGNHDVILLHCVSNYPADPADANLRAMHTLRTAFGVPVGFSDHTLGIEVAPAAVALGADVVEKHFTLDRNLPGPDHRASLEPDELTTLVASIRTVEAALGCGRKQPVSSELVTARIVRKSLVAAQDIPAGTILTQELVAIQRPGTGLPPAMRSRLIGRCARRDIKAGELLDLEMIV